jgi:hypothetical protein
MTGTRKATDFDEYRRMSERDGKSGIGVVIFQNISNVGEHAK